MLPAPHGPAGDGDMKPPPRRDGLPVRSGYPFSKPTATRGGRVTALRSKDVSHQGPMKPSDQQDQGGSDCLTGSEYVRILTTLAAADYLETGTELAPSTDKDHDDRGSYGASTWIDLAKDVQSIDGVSCDKDGSDHHTSSQGTTTGHHDISRTSSARPVDVIESKCTDYQSPGHKFSLITHADEAALDEEQINTAKEKEQEHNEDDPRNVLSLFPMSPLPSLTSIT